MKTIDLRTSQRLRDFVTKNFYVPDTHAFDDVTSFLQQGILDSTGVLELVTFVENEFGITVAEDELVPSNFDSISALSDFIARKRGPSDVLS